MDNPHIIVLGRAGLDLYPDPPGTKIEDALTFTSALGGSSGNIAAGLGRLGSRVSLLGRVSDDAVGKYTLNQCAPYGIGTDNVVVERSEVRTTLALSETRTGDTQTVIYRNDAADLNLQVEDVEWVEWETVNALIFTGTSLAKEPSRTATLTAIDMAKAHGITVMFDVDHRAYSWASVEEAAQVCGAAAEKCHIIIGNDDEFGVLAGDYDKGRAHAEALATDGRICVYKRGADGSITFDGSGGDGRDGDSFDTGIYPVTAIKPTGAGDAFMASFAHNFMRDVDLRTCVARGSAAAAIVVTRVGCAPAMPTEIELADFMSAPSSQTA
ncbi:5-dehydro-2-deoxygluconokinase [Ahrensia sp. R2A130]|uniref:5-dehydro-2-deoxygluconokinase n=1 Tax=Ahrensia sp. R2A130 TaxID=744979 RepID=UPI0001E0CA5F|nr:5-dehydro-2-deoxygluconokinase [Ahrensia sp. R2A130]EFL87657.1 5-dehydro-2-deoxygluconokinase [Ahrensia sp. R2A130]